MSNNKTGVLLINLGTPEAPTEAAVRAYLTVFLSDPYVITLPKILRNLLVQKIILPKRPQLSARAYQQIWTPEGSPLMVNSLALKNALQIVMPNHKIALGMRYNNPSIESALHELKECQTLLVLPLYPQYARATTESALQEVSRILKKNQCTSDIKIIRAFHSLDFYIDALRHLIAPFCIKEDFEFLLLSYHGLPKRQPDAKQYQKDCHATSSLIANQLNLRAEQYQTAFQSRLGFTQWIPPYTDHVIKTLRQKNIRHLTVACPSFVADCVETAEEIHIRLKSQWMALGGTAFTLIPCLNANDDWVNALARYLCYRETSCLL